MGTTVDYCVCCGSSIIDQNPALWMPFVSSRALGLPPINITKAMGLRTIETGTGYAMCKSLHCISCGHLFVDYRFNDSEMMLLYSDYRGEAYAIERNIFEPGYLNKNDSLEAGNSYRHLVEKLILGYLPQSDISILDWGGDNGKNTPFPEKAKTLHICDISGKKPAIESAVNVYGTQDFLENYDLLILANVLEHLPFPDQTIQSLTGFMSESSILYVEVPYETLQYEAQKDPPYALKNKKLHWHEHINFFSAESMHSLLSKNGLKVIENSVSDIFWDGTGVSFSKLLQAVCKRAT